MGRILGIDYGLIRTGLAVTDPLQIIATGLDTVPSKDVIPYLKKYLADEVVDGIAIGLPRDLQNRETHGTNPVKKFIEQLEKFFPEIPITTIDERFTSSIAAQTMALGGYRKKARQKKGNLDKVSATLILQTYLEQKKI